MHEMCRVIKFVIMYLDTAEWFGASLNAARNLVQLVKQVAINHRDYHDYK